VEIVGLDTKKLGFLAEFIRIRNVADDSIAKLIGRPADSGAIAEHIAAVIFDIALHPNAVHKASDGRFRSGPYIDQSVNVKYASQNSGLLDLVGSLNPVDHPDIYLVITGPRISTASSLKRVTPWVITDVYLFKAPQLVDHLRTQDLKIGTATSIRKDLWEAAHIYPATNALLYPLSAEQRLALQLFGPVLEEDR
jgi:hypothetical protein